MMKNVLPNVGEDEEFIEIDYTQKKTNSLSPFDFLKSINSASKTNLMRDTDNDDLAEKSYIAWVVNNGLSYFPDTILYANLVNEYHHLSNRAQYEFLLNSIRPKKRYAEWIKSSDDEDLNLICNYYECNRNVAKDYLSLLSKEQIDLLREKQKIGGINE